MRRIERVINSVTVSLLEITVYDQEDQEEIKMYRDEKNLILGMDMLPYLNYFSEADYIVLTGGELGTDGYEPLYEINPRALVINYENTDARDDKIDLSKFTQLEYLFTRSSLNCTGYSNCASLKTLVVFQWQDDDLYALAGSKIDSLEIIGGRLRSLRHIDRMDSLQVLYLSYLRRLSDLSDISRCGLMKKLRIENCGKVQLPESGSLEYLSFSGSNRVESLNGLSGLPNLKYILLDGILVEDGKMDCLRCMKHAVLFQNRRHYSAADAELPKDKMSYVIGEIPKWRQFLP